MAAEVAGKKADAALGEAETSRIAAANRAKDDKGMSQYNKDNDAK